MATFHKHLGTLIDVTYIAFLALIYLFFALFAHPFRRGFFCDDDSIRYPFLANTISSLLLVVVSFITPVIFFFAVEGFRLLDTSTPQDSWNTVSTNLFRNLYEMYVVFMLGAGLNQVTVDLAKYTVGRLRPHFLEVCSPSETVCPSTSTSHQYVTSYTCTGDEDIIEDARLSFPSGHAALAFYVAIYVAVFLQHRLYWRSVRLPRHLAQAAVLMVAWFTALSRIQDNMHHPTDVLAGIAIGSIWAFVMTSYVTDFRLDSSGATKEEIRSVKPPGHIQGANGV